MDEVFYRHRTTKAAQYPPINQRLVVAQLSNEAAVPICEVIEVDAVLRTLLAVGQVGARRYYVLKLKQGREQAELVEGH